MITKYFELKRIEDDYLVCREWDGTNLGAEDVFVEKPKFQIVDDVEVVPTRID